MPFSVPKFKSGGNFWLTDKQAFYDALSRVEPLAVRTLAGKIYYDVKQAALNVGLAPEDVEELVNDAVVITISNIRNGSFQFADFSPVAYANGVARKLIANRLRSKKPKHEIFEDNATTNGFDPEAYLFNKELEELMGKLLGKLEENCRTLLRLKYFDNLRDKEIVELKLTPYNSTDSLKSRRSQCLNKLIEMAKAARLLDDFQ